MATLLLVFPASNALSSEDEEWEFALLFPMIWASEINGQIDIGDNSFDQTTTFEDTLDSLSFGYMVEFYAKKGPWRYALKLNYQESEDEHITQEYIAPPGIPLVPSHKIKTEATQGTTDATLGYQLDNGLILYTGVRYIFSEIDLKITPLGSGIIEIEEKIQVSDDKLTDWLVGAEYQYKFAGKWSALFSADAAIAGDNDTDYAANILLSYQISNLNNVWLGYRYMRIADKFTEDGVRTETDFVTQGPTFGWAFTF
jgi:opacity protein-like surface antigen